MRNTQVHETKSDEARRHFDIREMLARRDPERYSLHSQHLNDMMVRVLRTLGFDARLFLDNRSERKNFM